jgi:hypothetical protein
VHAAAIEIIVKARAAQLRCSSIRELAVLRRQRHDTEQQTRRGCVQNVLRAWL